MIELLFLLLPIAAAYGWYMGFRSAKKSQEEISNKLSRDYVVGVNLLLSNQPEKAVDLFLNILQKQEQENNIETGSQFEAELTLGNLFRSRGEVDRALRIHQALDKNPNYSFEQKLLAKQQLAKDFMAVGFYDRVENINIMLVDEPEFAENALQQLSIVYQKTKEWKKAVNVAEKLAKIVPKKNNIDLAQYYCELAINLKSEDKDNPLDILKSALKVNPNCVRASMLLAEHYMLQLDYQHAVVFLENVLEQDQAYVGEVLVTLKYAYHELNQLDNFELFLIRASQKQCNSMVDLALTDLVEEKYGITAAQAQIYQKLHNNPSTLLFHRFIKYQIESLEDGKGKDSLILLYDMVGDRIKKEFGYRCTNCGYQTHHLVWCCPSCRQWETVKPISGIEHS